MIALIVPPASAPPWSATPGSKGVLAHIVHSRLPLCCVGHPRVPVSPLSFPPAWLGLGWVYLFVCLVGWLVVCLTDWLTVCSGEMVPVLTHANVTAGLRVRDEAKLLNWCAFVCCFGAPGELKQNNLKNCITQATLPLQSPITPALGNTRLGRMPKLNWTLEMLPGRLRCLRNNTTHSIWRSYQRKNPFAISKLIYRAQCLMPWTSWVPNSASDWTGGRAADLQYTLWPKGAPSALYKGRHLHFDQSLISQ